MDIIKIQHEGVKWIQIATDRIQQQGLVKNLTSSLYEKQQLRDDTKWINCSCRYSEVLLVS